MVVHTFGDSHSHNGFCDIPGVWTHPLGPKLCFSIGRDGISIKDGYGVEDSDTVVFCFGEIDCRCHVHRYVSENSEYAQIIETIVHNYFIQIKAAVDHFCNLKTVIYNVVPPIQKHNTYENPNYPYLGTDDQRKQYVLHFNERLRQKCIEYGFVFFDVYDKYTDENGYLDKSLSDGNVHIRDAKYIKHFVEWNLK